MSKGPLKEKILINKLLLLKGYPFTTPKVGKLFRASQLTTKSTFFNLIFEKFLHTEPVSLKDNGY